VAPPGVGKNGGNFLSLSLIVNRLSLKTDEKILKFGKMTLPNTFEFLLKSFITSVV